MDAKLKKELTNKMDKVVSLLTKDFSGLRTGRASANLLSSVYVDTYGNNLPISQVATITVPDAVTIAIQVWDQGMIKNVEKAIIEANLGVSPKFDGQVIRINMPPLSEERRKELVKLAYRYGENAKIAVRNARRDGMETVKKMEKNNDISKDDYHLASKEIQAITDDYISKIDITVKDKESNIIQI